MNGVDFIFVGLGGALGAVLRYLVSLVPVKWDFPILTLLTNLAGAMRLSYMSSVILGLSVLLAGRPPRGGLFWQVGVCGAFTTFSTFSLELFGLLEEGKYIHGAAYAVLSVALCLAGVWLGQALGRLLRA